jgi:hypothetical protein
MCAVGEKSKEVSACERDIQDANEVVCLILLYWSVYDSFQLETMELGVRSIADPNQRKSMEEKVRNYKKELGDLTNEMHAAESDISDKEKLFSGEVFFFFFIYLFVCLLQIKTFVKLTKQNQRGQIRFNDYIN